MKKETEKERRRVIRELLDVTDEEFSDEELIRQLVMMRVTQDEEAPEKLSLGQRASDAVASFAGSWAFIFSFIGVMVVWMIVNVLLAARAFDAYPFILLNLVLSCIAAARTRRSFFRNRGTGRRTQDARRALRAAARERPAPHKYPFRAPYRCKKHGSRRAPRRAKRLPARGEAPRVSSKVFRDDTP